MFLYIRSLGGKRVTVGTYLMDVEPRYLEWTQAINWKGYTFVLTFRTGQAPNILMSRLMIKPTKRLCAQHRLRSDWASANSDQSSLCPQWKVNDPSFLHPDSEDSDHWEHRPFLLVLYFFFKMESRKIKLK